MGFYSQWTLANIGKKHNKDDSRRAEMAFPKENYLAIPRPPRKRHIAENLNIFDFNLEDSEMASIFHVGFKYHSISW